MKKFIVIILVIATVLNIVAGAFIFLDFQILTIPETTITLHVLTITADEAVLQANLSVNNRNPFSIFLENLTMVTSTDTGEIITRISLENGETKAHENTSFSTTAVIRFNDSLPTELNCKITGAFAVRFFGIIRKTLPLSVSIIASLNNILEQFALPQIHLAANFSEITQEGVNLTGSLDITNPNFIDLKIEDLSVAIETETGTQVGTITIQGARISANSSQRLTGSGWILLKALDAKTLRLTMNTDVIIIVAGMRKPLDLSVDAEIIPPRIAQILSDLPTDASLTGKYRYTLKGGLQDEITFQVDNPNKLTLLAKDITVKIYRIDRNRTRLISNGTLEDGIIAPQATTVLKGEMFIPLVQLWPRLGERIIPDRLQMILRANITIPGLNQTIWIGVIGYQDFPIHWLNP